MEQSTGEQAVTRRDALKKAAVAGAAVAWAAPTVQFLGQGVAGAQAFGSTCPGCLVSFDFNTTGSDPEDGNPLNIGRTFTATCIGGNPTTPASVSTAWTTSGASNCTFPANGTGTGISGVHSGSGTASVDFTCTITFTCRCFQQQSSVYSCTSTGSASWPQPFIGNPANPYGVATGSDSCARCQ